MDEEIFIENKVVCIRLEPKYEAKSYQPNALVADSKMKMIGGRKYNTNEIEEEKAKLYFVKTTTEELGKLKSKLDSGAKDNVKVWHNQVCMIRSIDLLGPNEKVLGFDDNWESGTIEAILHPLGDDIESVLNGFYLISGLDKKSTVVRTYEDGLTFICANMDRNSIEKIKRYNPLRSLKPLMDDVYDPFRMGAMTGDAPQLPDKIYKSNVKVGIFDGGVDNSVPLLKHYVNCYDMVKEKPTKGSIEHGTGVSSAILFGEMSKLSSHDKLSNPYVTVESFRVFPMEKTGDAIQDFEMYSTIDIIEKVVSERKDIKLFNVSIGPRGPILDDDLNRFTYALDKLTYNVEEDEVNPLFCIAVGNDGNAEFPANRIQSPSDMVNGLAVGAYTYNGVGDKIRAEYSCMGPGREGAKIKPDILEFGGSQSRPFIMATPEENKLGCGAGTSLASPVVAGKIGRLVADSESVVPHLGRTLLIHNAENESLNDSYEYGFGFAPAEIDKVLECTDNRVTILYNGIMRSSTSVKLPVFMPNINEVKGNMKIHWTISTIVNPNVNDPDAYTNNCIEDTFYPNDMNFNFRKGKGSATANLLTSEGREKAEKLLKQGYSRSDLPVSKPAKKRLREKELRNSDFKWDTIIRKNLTMRASSLMNPFLTLHAIGRDEYEHEKIRYYVAITIEVPKMKGSLYDNILQTYENLTPIHVQNVNRVMTEVLTKNY